MKTRAAVLYEMGKPRPYALGLVVGIPTADAATKKDKKR